MRKLLMLTPLLLLALACTAQAAEKEVFPLDKGAVWIYDDGTVERITGFRKIELPAPVQQGRDRGKKLTAHVFFFESFNHEPRAFFVLGTKMFEWAENNQRLIYDFGAEEGAQWPVKWVEISQQASTKRDWRLSDINEGAVMTLVEKNAKVKTPLGEFENCFHFRLKRAGTADAGFVDEWIVPGVGCVQRAWDTIAGEQRHRLVRIERPKTLAKNYRMDVKLDRAVYKIGEDIGVEVSVLNWSDQDITLKFPSGLQVDYTIDDTYTWSSNHAVIQATTEVTIPARDVYKWNLTHTPDDYALEPGEHTLVARVIDTPLTAHQKFLVVAPPKEIPAGLEVSASLVKESFGTGEPTGFSVSLKNTTSSDITLKLPEELPLWYKIGDFLRFPEYFADLPELVDVVVPANDTIVLEGRHNPGRLLLKPGEYEIGIGIAGYGRVADLAFTVTKEMALSTIRGVVLVPGKEEGDSPVPVPGAKVSLLPELPRNFARDLSNVPRTEKKLWTAVSGDDGAFELADVPLGLFYLLNVKKEGFDPYQRTIRAVAADAELKIVLRPERLHPDKPLNFRKRELGDIAAAFGTGRSVYLPDSPFKTFLRVHNTGENTVSFTFDSEDYLDVTIKDSAGNVLWTSTPGTEKRAATAEFRVDIAPGDTYVFEREETFEGKVPATGGKYIIEGALNYTSTSVETLDKDKMGGFVKVLVVPPEARRVEPKKLEARAFERQMVVDLKEDLRTFIDMTLKRDDVAGEINVAEIRKNLHKPRPKHHFVKMIEIDADETVREQMENAVIRIYYDESDFEGDFDPEKLVIAHWHENQSLDSVEEPDWEELESRVDTVNKFVEATTTSFSSFGLFVSDESTAVEEETAPQTFALKQNSPNPFNPTTLIEFQIPESGFVTLTVYNVMGQVVERLVDDNLAAGVHRVMFDGSDCASGVYFYRLSAPGFTATRKMLLIK